MAKKRRAPVRQPEIQRAVTYASQRRSGAPRRQTTPPSRRGQNQNLLWLGGGAAVVAVLVVAALAFNWIPGFSLGPGASPTPSHRPVASRGAGPFASPAATPLASPPAEPAGDGTTVTIATDFGDIVIEVYNESSPVAATNFVNLADAGYYNGLTFHRIVPGFVIQGGDPEGTGGGGPGYEIKDDAVVGEYTRGVVAMARPANSDGSVVPDSQGSQFFICLDDLTNRLPESGMYAILGVVVSGMDAVDAIAAVETGGGSGEMPIDPVVMSEVTVQRP
jgi:peptidyl-prolyl cis-trans isomerase B (cyclophilin B)